MLVEAFPKLHQSGFIRAVRVFFRSWVYIALIAVLMVFSELFSLELAVFWTYLAIGAFALIVGEDTLPIVPIAACSYMTISAPNNVGKHAETVFSDPAFLAQFLFILALAVVLLLGRLVTRLVQNPPKRVPSLSWGFLALGVSYVLGGLLSEGYGGRTAFFGFVQIAALCTLYFYFFFTVDWEKTKKDYVLFLFCAIGLGLVAETAGMYFQPWVDLSSVQRTHLYTGWGIYNNVGGVMAMCLPAPFYFSAVKKNGWIFTIAGSIVLLGIVLTQSRTSILFGAVVYLVSAVTVLVKAKRAERIKNVIVFAALLVAAGICVLILRHRLAALFESMFNIGLNPFGRPKIYEACWKKFLERPFFGVGFYETPGGLLSNGGIADLAPCPPDAFMPPRAHNTYMQLLASGGAVAFLAYLFHRAQTLFVLFRRPTMEKTFIAYCILGLILTSTLDCHFFNFGPGLLYSVLLVFAEGHNKKEKLFYKRAKDKPKLALDTSLRAG